MGDDGMEGRTTAAGSILDDKKISLSARDLFYLGGVFAVAIGFFFSTEQLKEDVADLKVGIEKLEAEREAAVEKLEEKMDLELEKMRDRYERRMESRIDELIERRSGGGPFRE